MNETLNTILNGIGVAALVPIVFVLFRGVYQVGVLVEQLRVLATKAENHETAIEDLRSISQEQAKILNTLILREEHGIERYRSLAVQVDTLDKRLSLLDRKPVTKS